MTFGPFFVAIVLALIGTELGATMIQMERRLEERTLLWDCLADRTRQLEDSLKESRQALQKMEELRANYAQAPLEATRKLNFKIANQAREEWNNVRLTPPAFCTSTLRAPEYDWEEWPPFNEDAAGPIPWHPSTRSRRICAHGKWEQHCGNVIDSHLSLWADHP